MVKNKSMFTHILIDITNNTLTSFNSKLEIQKFNSNFYDELS